MIERWIYIQEKNNKDNPSLIGKGFLMRKYLISNNNSGAIDIKTWSFTSKMTLK